MSIISSILKNIAYKAGNNYVFGISTGWWLIIFSIILLLVIWLIRNSFENFDTSNTEDNIDLLLKKNKFANHTSSQGNVSKGEAETKRVVEKIFNKPFNKIRPLWLKNEVTGQNLEIDVYNDDLKLAFEYSGQQHYKYIPFFHKNYEAFQTQRYRDEMKKTKCKENGITLIEIPYTIKIEDIESFIRLELNKRNIKY